MSIEYLTTDLEKIEYLKNLLKSRATSGDYDDDEYKTLRNDLLKKPEIFKLIPVWIKTSNSLDVFWQYIKNKVSRYDPRRKFIEDEFKNVTDYLKNNHDNNSSTKFDSAPIVSPVVTPKSLIYDFSSVMPQKTMQAVRNMKKIDDPEYTKIFISHSSKDKDIAGNVIDLLENIGILSTQIFCTSFPECGIEYGENFLDRIKTELNSNILVLFIFSKKFFESPVSLCEMGATWVKTNKHIPILVPSFSFSEVKGVFPLTQGVKMEVPEELTSFKGTIEKIFKLEPILIETWERKRKQFIKNINN